MKKIPKKLTRAYLASVVSERTGIPLFTAKAAVDCVINVFVDWLANGRNVVITNIMTFSVKTHEVITSTPDETVSKTSLSIIVKLKSEWHELVKKLRTGKID